MESEASVMFGIGNLLYWGVGLIFIFPLMILLLNEASFKLGQQDEMIKSPIQTFKHFVVPLGAFLLLITQVFGVNSDSIYIKIVETVLWVIIINTGLTFITRYFFTSKAAGKGSKIPQLFLDIFRILLVLLGGAIVLSKVWNIELTGLVTALGLGSFVLGLALQDTLGNLFSGIALVYERPFTVGDVIHVADHEGHVIEMNWRAVHIRTREGRVIVIPHLKIGQDVIVNHSKPKSHILKQEVSFSYQDAPNKVKEAMMEVLMATEGILRDPMPEVKTIAYSESSIKYELEYGIIAYNDRETIADSLMTNIWYCTQRYQLTIPYPQVSVTQAGALTNHKSEDDKEIQSILPLLKNLLPLSNEEVELIKDQGRLLRYAKGEILYAQDDHTGMLYLILEGQIQLSVMSEDQRFINLSTVQSGDIIGEIPLLSSRKSAMTATVIRDTRVLIIPLHVSSMWINSNKEAANALNQIIDGRRGAIRKKLAA